MSVAPAARIPRGGPAELWLAGRQALREVPGLRGLLIQGFLLLYLLTFVLAALGVGGLYLYVLDPLFQSLEAWSVEAGFWGKVLSTIGQALLWFGQFLLLSATLALSFLIAMAMMGVWFETLASRIVAHHRGSATSSARDFRIGTWLNGLGRSLSDAVWLLLLAMLALPLGFVPIVGPGLVILVESYLLGREVRDPYIKVRVELGEDPRTLRSGLGPWTVLVGLLPFGLAMLPVLGWALLPWVMVHLVAGFAWRGEQGWGSGTN